MRNVITWDVKVDRFKELVDLLDNGHVNECGILFEDHIPVHNGDSIYVIGFVPDVLDERNEYGYVQFEYESLSGLAHMNGEYYSEDVFHGAKIKMVDAYGESFTLRVNVI